MDIYFCDLCGNRVNDFDLKSGRSIRRVHDVICATCLDLGHGKEWLSKHQSQAQGNAAEARALAPVAMVAAAAGASRSSLPASGVIDSARDRARTLDDDHAQTVEVSGKVRGQAPVVVADNSSPVAPAPAPSPAPISETPAARAPSAVPERPKAKPEPVTVPNQLSAAAASFSALNAEPSKSPSDAAHDDLIDGDDADARGHAVISEDSLPDLGDDKLAGDQTAPSGSTRTPAELEAIDAVSDAVDAAEAKLIAEEDETDSEGKVKGKAETLPSHPSDQSSEHAPRETGKDAKPGPAGAPAIKKPQSKSATTTKITKGKLGKVSTRKRARGSDKTVMIVSCITLGAMLMFFIYMQFIKGHTPPAQVIVKDDPTVELNNAIGAAITLVNNTLNNPAHKMEDLNQAMQAILDIDNIQIKNFTEAARKQGMSEEDINLCIDHTRLHDLKAKRQTLLDEKVKIGQ